MNLYELCQTITGTHNQLLPAGHKLGPRLICPEYSKSAKEVKTYPLPMDNRIFALCWNISGAGSLRSTLCPAPMKFYYKYDFAQVEKTQLHTHNYIELAYVVKGEFHQRILGQDISFKEGELCLIDKNCFHQDYLTDEPLVVLFFGIANDMFAEVMDENITTEKIISFLQTSLLTQKNVQQYIHFKPIGNASEALEGCLCLLITELLNDEAGSSYIRKGLLLRIFRILSSTYEFSLSKEQQKVMNWIVFEEVSDYITKHVNTITVQDLVDIFHFQEDYFNRLIKKKTGLTYSAYVQQIRLSNSEKLLTTSKKSINEIAEACGYHNKGYFYKIFLKKYGMTPSEYRKKHTAKG